MSAQRHAIKRQVVELTIRGPARAQPVQDELSRIYRQRILPLIERRCNELSDPDQLYRIDSLDLDIGVIDLAHLEEDLTSKVDAALSRELARHIRMQQQATSQRGVGPRAQSQLELFAFFVGTGRLPWWADATRPGLLADNLEQLLRESPDALAHLIRELAHEPEPRLRMTRQYTDEQLLALCSLLMPAHRSVFARDFHELLAGLQSVAGTGHAARTRQSLWDNILIIASAGGFLDAAPEALYHAILQRMAIALNDALPELPPGSSPKPTAPARLVPALHRAIQDGRIKVNDSLAELISRLAIEKPGRPAPVSHTLAERLARLRIDPINSEPLTAAWARLEAMLPELPAGLQEELLAALNTLPPAASVATIFQHVLQVLEAGAAKHQHSSLSQDRLEVFRVAARAPASPAQKPTVGQPRQETPAEKNAVDLHFSEADEVPVSNAGLVILWPFLGHFFTHLGLLEDGSRFKDMAARQRAAGLLQVIATQDASPPEYLLPLNKLLCGLELSEVFDFGPPLQEQESAECAGLLEAVITQASILRDMSADGFRGSFLLRPGMLSIRDSFWLLRVERQTYDIVLERFPWNWEWVKLPWMEAALRVEW